MIQVRDAVVAEGIHIHTAHVQLEEDGRGIDRDGHRADRRHRHLKRRFVPGLYVDKAGILGAVIGRLVRASPVFAQVRVGGLGVNAFIVLDVLECLIHQTAVAALVSCWKKYPSVSLHNFVE